MAAKSAILKTRDEANYLRRHTTLFNKGKPALSLPDEVRVTAARGAERFKAFGYTIAQAIHILLKLAHTTGSRPANVLICTRSSHGSPAPERRRHLSHAFGLISALAFAVHPSTRGVAKFPATMAFIAAPLGGKIIRP